MFKNKAAYLIFLLLFSELSFSQSSQKKYPTRIFGRTSFSLIPARFDENFSIEEIIKYIPPIDSIKNEKTAPNEESNNHYRWIAYYKSDTTKVAFTASDVFSNSFAIYIYYPLYCKAISRTLNHQPYKQALNCSKKGHINGLSNFHKNGVLESTGFYTENGNKKGKWKYYNTNAEKIKIEIYKDGKLTKSKEYKRAKKGFFRRVGEKEKIKKC